MRSLCIILFLAFSSSAFAQQDSTRQYKDQLTKADSSSQRFNNKIDSVQGKINGLINPDLSLNAIRGKIKSDQRKAKKDSIHFYKEMEKEKKKVKAQIAKQEKAGLPADKFIRQLDSLEKVTYSKSSSSSDHSATKRTTKQMLIDKKDSLSNKLSGNKNKTKADSIAGLPASKLNEAESKVNAAEQKLNAPVNKVESTVNEKLALMNKEGGTGASIPANATIPDAGVNTGVNAIKPDLKPDNPLSQADNPLKGELKEVGEVKGKIGEAKNIPNEQIGKVKSIGEVKGAQEKLGAANDVTDKAQAYSGDVKNIASGNLGEVKEVPKALEGKVAKAGDLQGLQKEMTAFDQYKDVAGNDPAAMKQLALEQAQASFKPPVNHFAGQEAVLQKAMDNMTKLKSKYASLDSLKDIPKRKPNEMKGKPFIERIVPGITLQVQKNSDVLIDYNPYLGYRISGKLTAGAGWNERFSVGKHFHFSLRDRIYGPRVFVDFKFWKGFSVRTDVEKMNTYVPSVASGMNDFTHRAWVWSAFIGLKKEYKFWGSVKGNAQFLYNLYDDHNNSPYGDRFSVRMGFEFPMKKKELKKQA